MKRKILSLILCLLLLSAFVLHVSASGYLPMVIDSAELLSGQERIDLEGRAEALRTQYEMDVVILTVDSLEGKTAQDYADDYYDDNGYGYGSEYSGILFLLAMEEREWYISTCGEAISVFTDYGIQQLGDVALPYLSDGAYYDAFSIYLDSLPAYFDAYGSGRPVEGYADYSGDYYHGDRETVVYSDNPRPGGITPIVTSVVMGLVAALVTVLIMCGAMNTKRKQHSAGDYLKPGSYHLYCKHDMFLYSNVSKVRRQENNGGGHGGGHGGGSSVHRSSSGRSHGGGGGRF